ncbi:IDEAL domain-containing protein [Anoxybacteroides tepidamans]|uniref:IDEAL domain-containing protein n=1 Tax=Anoxybacteroides tepidamans TaxID=265948 RepID=UPI0004858443|nr:IDEAL domain-containing protein [Anoxybacillus tepidamans]
MYEKQYPHEGIMMFGQSEEKNSYGSLAEKILEQAIFLYQKNKLMEKIDEALSKKNKDLFLELSAQYNELLKKHGA